MRSGHRETRPSQVQACEGFFGYLRSTFGVSSNDPSKNRWIGLLKEVRRLCKNLMVTTA